MSNKAPHRHHYVPRMVQRNFTNEGGGLHFWRRGMTVGEVRSTRPSNLFVEDNLYTIVKKDGSRDHSIEHRFARLETLAAPLIRQFLNIVRHGMTPIMDRAYLDLWHVYNYHAQKRTVAWHSRFITQDDLRAVMQEIATEQQWTEHLQAWKADPEDVRREMNNARIASQVDPIPNDLLEECRSRGLVIYVAPARTSFILGDAMSVSATISSKGGRTGVRRAQFMPIAPDIAVGSCATQGVYVDQIAARDVRRMNEAMAKQSLLIAGRSHAQIASLSRMPYDPPDIMEGWFGNGDTKSE